MTSFKAAVQMPICTVSLRCENALIEGPLIKEILHETGRGLPQGCSAPLTPRPR